MENRRIYEPREVETEPLGRIVMVHGSMLYECESCGTIYKLWLEKGLEDRKQDEINPECHKPVPFCTSCTCGGTMRHIAWNRDEELEEYKPLKEDECYFENTEEERCGISHIRNNGVHVARREVPSFTDLEKMFAERSMEAMKDEEPQFKKLKARPTPREFVKQQREDFEDDPFGLSGFSTTTLKKELRRRKGI